MKILHLLWLTMAIAGCANTLTTSAPIPSPDHAVLIFSLSWSDKPGTLPGHEMTTSGVNFSLRNESSGKHKTFNVYEISGLSKTADFMKTNTPGAGSVFAVALPPGEYEFYRWRLYQGNYEIVSNYSPWSLRFALRPGGVLYLGELNLEITREPNDYQYGVFQEGIVNLDHSAPVKERDLNLAEERYPDLANTAVQLADITYEPQSYELYGDKNIAVLRDSRVIFNGIKSIGLDK